MAYFDCFWVCGILTLAIVPLVFFMKRSVTDRREHAAVE
jgi:hypothetical protein